MKKLGMVTALFVLALQAQAEEPGAYLNLSVAAAETASTISWTVEKAVVEVEERHSESLTEKTDALNEKLNAKLEKSLQDKFTAQLNY